MLQSYQKQKKKNILTSKIAVTQAPVSFTFNLQHTQKNISNKMQILAKCVIRHRLFHYLRTFMETDAAKFGFRVKKKKNPHRRESI
jgi:hypothetical protein